MKKRTLIGVACIVLVSMLSVVCIFATEAENGMTFTAEPYYRAVKTLESLPLTAEATVYFPADTAASTRGGAIISDYKSASSQSFGFEIHESGVPRLYIIDNGKKVYDIKFDEVNVYNGVLTHVAISYDPDAAVAYCYINGELKQTKSLSAPVDISFPNKLVLGGNNGDGNSIYFKGQIKNIALYSYTRSADEIASDALGMVQGDPMLYYDLSGCAFGDETITDRSGNGYDQSLIDEWFSNKDAVTDYAYSFAIVGDTQIISRDYPESFSKIYDYIIDNVEEKNIKFVMGLGDITDLDTEAEWTNAMANIKRMDGVVPYSLIRGNDAHDTKESFDKYVPHDEEIGGAYEEGSMLNVWYTFNVGSIQYLVMCLDFGPSDDVLAWAGEVIEAHPYHNVIITTHCFLARNGTPLDEYDAAPPTKVGGYNNGDHMWEKLIRKHENIVLVLSGHDPSAKIAKAKLTGDNGNTVTAMLIDPQGVDVETEGGTGLVAMLYFSEDGKTVQVEYYSTIKEKYYMEENQFTTTLDVIEAPVGRSFSATPVYKSVEPLSSLPLTAEATVYFSADTAASTRGGAIISDYQSASYPSFGFEIHQSGVPRLYLIDNNKKIYDVKFNEVNVYTGELTHVAITFDPDTDTVSCYINGELKQTKTLAAPSNITFVKNLVLGGNNASGNGIYFKGLIKNVALYAETRSADEIAKDYFNPGRGKPMAYFDLTHYASGISTIIADTMENYDMYSSGKLNAITMEGFSVRVSGYNGLRGLFSVDNNLIEVNNASGYTLLSYGTILASAENRSNCSLISDGNGGYTVKGAVEKELWNNIDGQIGKTLSSSTAERTDFAVTVVNFTEAIYNSDVYFCSYEIWQDTKGNITITYTDYEGDEYDEVSLYRICSEMWHSGAITEENDAEGIVKGIIDTLEAPKATLEASLAPDIWIDAYDVKATNGEGVSTLQNKANAGTYDATQSNEALQPKYIAPVFNSGKPTMRFTSSSSLTVLGSEGFAKAPVTVIAVVKPSDISTNGSIAAKYGTEKTWRFHLNAGVPTVTRRTGWSAPTLASESTVALNESCILGMNIFIANGVSNTYLYKNGNVIADKWLQSELANSANTPITIGDSAGSTGFVGDISEVLIYNRTLTAEELSEVNLYLAKKWEILDEMSLSVAENTESTFLAKGRTYERNSGLACDFTCSGIEFDAYCEGDVYLKLNTTDDTYFTVYVDGDRLDSRIMADQANTDYIKIADGLEIGEHNIEIIKQSQPSMSQTELLDVKINGEFLTKPAESEIFLEFYGDSILNGSNIYLGGTSAKTSDGTRAFGYLAAKELGADCNIIGRGGLGLVNNYVGGYNMLDLYDLCGAYEAGDAPEYDFARVPDAVVIELGVNDYVQNGGIDAEEYKAGVCDFVGILREKYGADMPIVWVYGYRDDEKDFWVSTKEALDALIAEGDGNIYYCPVSPAYLTAAEGGDNYHPNVAQAEVFGSEVAEFLKELLNLG